MRRALFATLLLPACTATPATSPALDASSPEAGIDASIHEAGADDLDDGAFDGNPACAPPQMLPYYTCEPGVGDAGVCPAYGALTGPPFYPLGCVYALNQATDQAGPCTNRLCTCGGPFQPDGGDGGIVFSCYPY